MKASLLLRIVLLGLLACGSAFADTINCATSNAAYTVGVGSTQATVNFAISGLTACSGTLTVEGTADNSTWTAINAINPATGVLSTTVTADQQFMVNSAGWQQVRTRVSSTGTGTITANAAAAPAVGAVTFSTPVTIQPGNTPNTTPWLVANPGYTSTQIGSTVTTHLTFQSALASSSTRHGCLFVNTSADKMWVFFGATGSATTSNAIPLSAGQNISCGLTGGGVATDNMAVTSNATDGATYVVVSQ